MLLNALARDQARTEFIADAPPETSFDVAAICDVLDDRTTRYVLETRPAFSAAKRAAAQLAGVLVLAAASGRGIDPSHPMLDLAFLAIEEASDQVRGHVPPPRARHHHRHLVRAIGQVFQALASTRDAGRSNRGDVTQPLALLKDAWQELHWTSTALPGFEIVDLDQACCAFHGPKK